MDKSILLIEDNADDEAMTIRALTKGKVKNEIIVVRDGQEALDYLFFEGDFKDRQRRQPEVILLDLNLPKVGGLEVLSRIRKTEITRLLPVVVLTSSREENDLIASYSSGANSFIVKPVDMDQFNHSVQQLQLYWLVLNQSPSGKVGG